MDDQKSQWRDVKTMDDIPFDELESLFESSFQEIAPVGGKAKVQKNPLNTPLFDANSEVENKDFKEGQKSKDGPRAKPKAQKNKPENPTLGDQYSKEVEKIRGEYGDLETMRLSLGLSKRRMALLLMVDPSAWTRWVKKDGQAPPHIWRALQWYMILQSKHPELSASLWLNTLVQPQIAPRELQKIKEDVLSSSMEESRQNLREGLAAVATLENRTQGLKNAQRLLTGLVGLHILLAFLWVLFLS